MVRAFSMFLSVTALFNTFWFKPFHTNCPWKDTNSLLIHLHPHTLKTINIYLLIQIHFPKEHNCGIFIFCTDTSSFIFYFLFFWHCCLCLRHLYTEPNLFILLIILTYEYSILFNYYPNWNLTIFCSYIRKMLIDFIGEKFAYQIDHEMEWNNFDSNEYL